MHVSNIQFPTFTGIRCLMMPYIQGDPASVPEQYRTGYEQIIHDNVIKRGDIGFLTIDESPVQAGKPHRGKRAKCGRALHTEAGIDDTHYRWGGGGPIWGGSARVILDRDTQILLANNIDGSCAIWDAIHENTSIDGDIGYSAALYPYESAVRMKAGQVHQIGILQPHESLPVAHGANRQFLRIIGSGVHGREDHFTQNPLMGI